MTDDTRTSFGRDALRWYLPVLLVFFIGVIVGKLGVQHDALSGAPAAGLGGTIIPGILALPFFLLQRSQYGGVGAKVIYVLICLGMLYLFVIRHFISN